jgi:hypothetical protein
MRGAGISIDLGAWSFAENGVRGNILGWNGQILSFCAVALCSSW